MTEDGDHKPAPAEKGAKPPPAKRDSNESDGPEERAIDLDSVRDRAS